MTGMSVLVVEDDPINRKVMDLLLKGRMKLFEVTIFEDSREFLTRVSALNPIPDIVLLDIHVEPHSGFEMIAMLRSLSTYAAIPIVALTASVMNDEVEHLRNSGFHSLIAKPVDLVTFPDVLNRILNGERFWRVLD